jgi:hypothetical protein
MLPLEVDPKGFLRAARQLRRPGRPVVVGRRLKGPTT